MTIQKGLIIATISGGSLRYQPVEKPLLLDASKSYDQDSLTLPLSFYWTCTLISFSNYGDDCSDVLKLGTGRDKSLFTLPSGLLDYSKVYSFTVRVLSLDLREATASVSVNPTLSGVSILFTTSEYRFNYDSTMSLSVLISANYSVHAYWTVFSSGENVNEFLNPNTPIEIDVSASEAQVSLSFPCAFPPYSFTPGRSYTFRLSAFPTGRFNFTCLVGASLHLRETHIKLL